MLSVFDSGKILLVAVRVSTLNLCRPIMSNNVQWSSMMNTTFALPSHYLHTTFLSTILHYTTLYYTTLPSYNPFWLKFLRPQQTFVATILKVFRTCKSFHIKCWPFPVLLYLTFCTWLFLPSFLQLKIDFIILFKYYIFLFGNLYVFWITHVRDLAY